MKYIKGRFEVENTVKDFSEAMVNAMYWVAKKVYDEEKKKEQSHTTIHIDSVRIADTFDAQKFVKEIIDTLPLYLQASRSK